MSPHIPTLQRLAAYVLSVKPERIAPDTDLVGELGLDSLDQVELIVEIEQEYGVDLNTAEFEECRTIAALAAHLDRLGIRVPSAD